MCYLSLDILHVPMRQGLELPLVQAGTCLWRADTAVFFLDSLDMRWDSEDLLPLLGMLIQGQHRSCFPRLPQPRNSSKASEARA
jgi:hypothetical protein